ncbi:hypothetical protein A2954_02370 [Candidatus Roizmanbacteria bacterium RIFCSPLOWO2_01_FULL_37_12]|uniref:Uncharacterized protein n=1 Tax=Candidatus Roizmanbacteria bacterium RIFCSPLOWO2_01_FULL_37_12 TaxID=1802056 RepID=A0A1F7I8D3_9BACT|nr:MAG: hypothetical protein A3D76_05340 [Candidatus Roizmanbacteria bacterium RIFCSPHIGHO2_02_FULL_37_9b]OGK39613.1 MAG: hypothetical protein A2954_02370 [Candidatus Roizmanbacteria bacterium RIFCSPLOWO2_01_FULL_37_12]
MIDSSHAKYHSSNAFCGSAGPEEMQHLMDLIEKLTDKELKDLVKSVGIKFETEPNDRDEYERVVDEADREAFYREYRKILKIRKTKLF